MDSFSELNLTGPLLNAIDDLGFSKPTPIQAEVFSVIRSGKDVVGISQTGTGKTLAYMLPILRDLGFSKQAHPRVLVLVPTRELVVQVVENIESFAKYMTLRIAGVYGGVNINTQALGLADGCDVLVATPGRLYDLVLARAIQLKSISKLVIDEVDVMLDLGFRFQINNLLELMPERRQNIMFSATMTEDIDTMIDDFFIAPSKVAISLSGTPLDNIAQTAYRVKNFYTKVNLLTHLIADRETFHKVLVFVSSKKNADRLFEALEPADREKSCVIHSNKTQNYRLRSIEEFDKGYNRMLIATDVMARGLDLDKISHVINFDTPAYPENYIHRIGRTGRAEQEGKSILFSTEAEEESKLAIEVLMNYEIPTFDTPEEVEIATRLIPDERPKEVSKNHNRNTKHQSSGPSTHEKSAKNKKVNLGGSYHRELAKKYKKAKTKGDKNANRRRK